MELQDFRNAWEAPENREFDSHKRCNLSLQPKETLAAPSLQLPEEPLLAWLKLEQ